MKGVRYIVLYQQNVVMETLVPAEYFTTEMVTKNGSYVYGIPIKEGKTVATVWYCRFLVGWSYQLCCGQLCFLLLIKNSIYIIIYMFYNGYGFVGKLETTEYSKEWHSVALILKEFVASDLSFQFAN